MDRIPLSRAVPIYLAAVILAIAGQPLNVYDFHARGLGTETFEPWRTTISAGITRVTSALRVLGQFLWPHRQALAGAAALLAVVILVPHPAHAHGLTLGLIGGRAVTQIESDLKAVSAKAKALLETQMRACAEAVVTPASADGRTPAVLGRLRTDAERAEVQAILDEGKALRGQLDRAQGDANQTAEIGRLLEGMVPNQTQAGDGRQPAMKSLGTQLVENPQWQAFIKSGGHRAGSAWASPSIELMATTLDTTSGSGGQLIITDYQPGILPLLFKRLMVADLIAPGTTIANSITYFKETTFTNAAAAVAEGTTKPESTLVFAQQTDNVHKIAHWLPVTEEMLEDVEQIRSYVDMRLRLGVALAEEDQLLNGAGTGANIQGILLRIGLTPAQARGADTNADAIFKQITTIATTVFIQPDGIVMNPANWQTIQLMKTSTGAYYGSGPFGMAQGGIGTDGVLWGLPVARTPSIVANTALVGAFRQASQFFRKGGLRVEASNSHADFFVKNLVAIRAEERGALAVYRPAAFGTVTGLN